MRIILPILLVLGGTALASSPEEWDRFRQDVNAACSELLPQGPETVIEVNPFGSESYGAALIVQTEDQDFAQRYICIYDKQSGAAELTAPFNPPEEVTEITTDPDGNLIPMTSETTEAELADP